MSNLEKKVISDFGKEWKFYNQHSLRENELKTLFDKYFNIFPFNKINKRSEGFDMGCGSGRWAKFIAPKVKKINCIEPSQNAISAAKENLKVFKNCIFFNDDVFNNSLKNNSQDFGYCLGVLHHIEDTEKGLKSCIEKLKKGAPFLLYIYYKLDNKPYYFRLIWQVSNLIRLIVSKLPFKIKLFVTQIIAIFIYFPLAKTSLFFEKLGLDVSNIPISSYKNTTLYTMKTDSLDRFGTRLEQRFTKKEIYKMMESCGLINIKFSNKEPYWVAVGEKK